MRSITSLRYRRFLSRSLEVKQKWNVCPIPALEMRIELESSTWRLALSGTISGSFAPPFEIFIDGTRITGISYQERSSSNDRGRRGGFLKETIRRLQDKFFQGHKNPLSRGIALSTSIGYGMKYQLIPPKARADTSTQAAAAFTADEIAAYSFTRTMA